MNETAEQAEPVRFNDAINKRVRLASGEINDERRLVAFLYVLMRDHLTPGHVEEIMRSHIEVGNRPLGEPVMYTNGWLASYAQDLADRLEKSAENA